MKTWQVGPYDDDWVVIVHAETRGQARQKGSGVDFSDFIDMRATRLPTLDGKLITTDALLEAGFPEVIEGYPLDVVGYILDCGCDLCLESLRIARMRRVGKSEGKQGQSSLTAASQSVIIT